MAKQKRAVLIVSLIAATVAVAAVVGVRGMVSSQREEAAQRQLDANERKLREIQAELDSSAVK